MKKNLLLIAIFLLPASFMLAQQHRLHYSKPAAHWLEALPIGNSHLGAMAPT